MTIEDQELPPSTGDEELIRWHLKRMTTFFDETRKWAVAADDRKATLAQANTPLGLREALKVDPLFKDYVELQQMYDRWTVREAEMAQALTAFVQLRRDVRKSTLPPVSALAGRPNLTGTVTPPYPRD